jgi:multiple sugar transport system substrate-binding protein
VNEEKSMTKKWLALVLMTILGLAFAACGGDDDSSSSDSSASKDKPAEIKGQEIKVLMPYKVPAKLLDQFTAETGVKVEYNVAGWDSVASKLVVAHQAGTYIADVTEFDWSFTGQYGGNGWYEPLGDLLSKETIDDLGSTNAAFTSEGNLYAACYSNDFRMSIYNAKMFKRAGISEFPATLDDLRSTLDQLKAKKVADFPMSLPMGATEGSVTPWYLLTLAHGGALFDEDNKPLFAEPDSAGAKALQFEIDALKNGWVSPGSVTLDDGPAFDRFTGGGTAVALAVSPGNLPQANDPEQSSIAPNAKGGLVPGSDGPGGTFGLQEGLGIPTTAEHKEAAAAFIEWWLRPEVQTELYEKAAFLPCTKSALDELSATGRLQDGKVVTEEFDHIKPLFPSGAPTWYSQFSSEAQGLLNAAFKGEIPAQEALERLADKATELGESAG